MDQDKKNSSGAPSTDTTSALFVSQRKKQLEQQEADRRAREKEEQRQAAEAEVRRLEQDVEDRKRKAEEEAKQVAEEAMAKRAQAKADPNSVLGVATATKEKKESKIPSLKLAGSGDGAAAKPMDKKKMAIIGGAVGAIVLILIIFAVIGSGGKSSGGGGGDLVNYTSSQKGLNFSYPSSWLVDDASAESLTITNETLGSFIILMDITADVNKITDSGVDIITAVETLLQEITAAMVGGPVSGLEPKLQKTGSAVTGSAVFTYEDADLGKTDADVNVTVINERIIVDVFATTDEANAAAARTDYDAIIDSVQITAVSTADDTSAASSASSEVSQLVAPDGFNVFTSSNGLTMVHPENWPIADSSGDMRRDVVTIANEKGDCFMLVANYADESTGLAGQDIYDEFMEDAVAALELNLNLAEDMQEVKGHRSDTKTEQYGQWVFFPNDIDVYFSVVIFNDDKGTVQGVVMLHRSGDEESLETMGIIMESIDAV